MQSFPYIYFPPPLFFLEWRVCLVPCLVRFISLKEKKKKEGKKENFEAKTNLKKLCLTLPADDRNFIWIWLIIQQWIWLEYVILIFFTDIALIKDKRKWYVLQMQHWICICGRKIGFRTLFYASRCRMCESSSKDKKVCKEIPIPFSVNICNFLGIISFDILYKFLNPHSLLRKKMQLTVKISLFPSKVFVTVALSIVL